MRREGGKTRGGQAREELDKWESRSGNENGQHKAKITKSIKY